MSESTIITATAEADEGKSPLTCTWCRSRPAAHMAISDWLFKDKPAAVRQQDMLCTPCARQTSILPGECLSWWLFDLTLHDYEGGWPS